MTRFEGLLDNPNPAVRERAVRVLPYWEFESRFTLRCLARAMEDPDPMVRRRAVDVAGGLGMSAKPLLPALQNLKTDAFKDVSRYAALAAALLEYQPSTSHSVTASGYDLYLND